jgi:hypothetical protein
MSMNNLEKLLLEARSMNKVNPPVTPDKGKGKPAKVDLKTVADGHRLQAVADMESPEDLAALFNAITRRLFWHYVLNHGFGFFSARSGAIMRHIDKFLERACPAEFVGFYRDWLKLPAWIEVISEAVKPYGFICKQSDNGSYWTNRSGGKAEKDITPV